MTQAAQPIYTPLTALASESDANNSLDGMNVTVLQDGTFAFVQTGAVAGRVYRFDADSTAAADGVSVVQPLGVSGAGRWVVVLVGGQAASQRSSVPFSAASLDFTVSNPLVMPAVWADNTVGAIGIDNAVEVDGQYLLPYAGSIVGLQVLHPVAGVAPITSFDYTVRINGVDVALTLNVPVASTAFLTASPASPIPFAAGSLLSLRVLANGGTATGPLNPKANVLITE